MTGFKIRHINPHEQHHQIQLGQHITRAITAKDLIKIKIQHLPQQQPVMMAKLAAQLAETLGRPRLFRCFEINPVPAPATPAPKSHRDH